MYETERYKYVYVNRKKIPEHVLVWEQANGPKPEGCDIHHIDGNGKNNALENLVCLTKSEHKMLHAKLKLEGKDVVDGTDPMIIAYRARNNANAKAHRQAHLEEERARDRAEYQKNKEHKLELGHSYYQRHREELRASQAQYEKEHKAERSARNATYYQEHKEARKAYIKAYNEAHKEERAEKKRKYNEQNKEKIAAYKRAYREVHAASEVFKRAVKKGLPEEQLAPLRQRLEQAKLDFQKKKGESK